MLRHESTTVLASPSSSLLKGFLTLFWHALLPVFRIFGIFNVIAGLNLYSLIPTARTLQVGDRPTKLAQAVAELGRIDKTIRCLTYGDDEVKRRRTLVQLNRGEDRHKLARAVFHGKRGELRQRYREGQQVQLGALGLVVNIIVLWNSLYIDAVLNELREEGYSVRPEDVARLSPLVFEHINLLGRYTLSVPESVQQGNLRPLRNPSDSQDDIA